MNKLSIIVILVVASVGVGLLALFLNSAISQGSNVQYQTCLVTQVLTPVNGPEVFACQTSTVRIRCSAWYYKNWVVTGDTITVEHLANGNWLYRNNDCEIT